nr:MAG: hypothetical protein [Lokiarchaeota virus Ratatoskr Meg22_1012]
MKLKTFESKLYFHNKHSDMHYLKVSTALAREEDYPFRPNKKIKNVIVGKALVFYNEDDEEELLKQINDNSTPTFKELIKKEQNNEDVYFEW